MVCDKGNSEDSLTLSLLLRLHASNFFLSPPNHHPPSPTTPTSTFPSSPSALLTMDEIGIQLSKEDPTFTSVVSETTKLLASLPQADEELYGKWKRLEGHEEFLDLQEVSNDV